VVILTTERPLKCAQLRWPVLAGVALLLTFQLWVDMPLSAGPQDSCTYYFIARSNLKYLVSLVVGDAAVFSPAMLAEQHVVPCTMPVAKPMLHAVHTLFAAVLPASFDWLGVGQAVVAVWTAILLAHASNLVAEESTPGGPHGIFTPVTLLALLCSALSTSQLYYSAQFMAPSVTCLFFALLWVAYLRFAQRPSPMWACLLGMAVALTLMTHLNTIPFIVAICTVELISLLRERSSMQIRIAHLARALACLFIVVAIVQTVTWIPKLGISDPSAWKFTAYYSRPYGSYLDQLAWYGQYHVDHAEDSQVQPAFDRFLEFTFYPLVMAGPVVVLALIGWGCAFRQVWLHSWTPARGCLLLVPAIGMLWYGLHTKLCPDLKGIAPAGLFAVVLQAYGLTAMFRAARRSLWMRAVVWGSIAVIVVAQIAHLAPLVSARGAYSEVRAWVRARGESRVVGLVRQGILEAAGLTTYGFEGGRSEAGKLGAWGLRPSLKMDAPDVPSIVVVSQRDYLDAQDKAFLKLRGIDPSRPDARFSDFSPRFYYTALYERWLARLLATFSPALAQKVEAKATRWDEAYRGEDVFVFVAPKVHREPARL
jgi:hypothetical protein